MGSHLRIRRNNMGLIVSRKTSEVVVIETDKGPIEIMVTEVSGSKVKLKIDCSRDFLILRKELMSKEKQ